MSTQSTPRRSLAPTRPAAVTFDERLWPVVLALLGLAGIGAAAIVTTGNFEDPRWWNNGGTWLGSLAVVTGLLVWGVSRLDRAQRGLQLAAVLSLILHIALFAALNQRRMIALAEDRSLPHPELKPVEEFDAPDYHIRAPDAPQEAHEKPLDTALPTEQEMELERIEKQRLAEQQPPRDQPAPLEAKTPELEPHVLPLRQPEEAAPRMADASGELSRAEPQPIELSEQQPVAAPAQQAAADLSDPTPAEAALNPRELPLETGAAASAQQSPAAPQTTPREIEAAALARRTVQESPAFERPATSDAFSIRTPQTPQLSAPQVDNIPRLQLGVDEPLEAPQPLVKAPLRAGSGSQLPVELGTTRDPAAQRVAIGAPGAAERGGPIAEPRRLPTGDSAPALAPAASASALQKSSAPVNVTSPAANVGPAMRVAARPASPPVPAPLEAGSTSRLAQGAPRLPAPVAAPEGIGGTGREIAPDAGAPSRRAREENQVADANARLLARTSGGPPTIDGRTREPAAAFARRAPLRRERDGGSDATTAQTEAAIELGLVFLARHQAPDGHWSLQYAPAGDGNPDPATVYRADTAATGLALLSFLGAGYDHYGGQYAHVVQRALDYLVAHQQANGDLYQPEGATNDRNARLYSHGIAAIALCEAYGMTGDRALAAPAQKAIDFIVASQDARLGGWRYVPGAGADTSVSGWQLMALKSGELAGLAVPRTAYDKIGRWLDRAQASGSQYAYNPVAPDTPQQAHGRRPTSSMTAVGLLMRLYTGLNRSDAHMIEGANHLLVRLPENGTPSEPARDTYYWYYATQVMFHMRGKYWQAWNDRLHPLLVGGQVQQGPLAGSWDPRAPVFDRWGPQAGRLYVTTLNLLSLEVHYRHLPLYESTAK